MGRNVARRPCVSSAAARRATSRLSRQSWLAEELFEPAEVGSGIATEPRPQHAGVPTALEAGAHLPPTLAIGTGQIGGVPAAQPGGQTGEEIGRASCRERESTVEVSKGIETKD